VAPVHYDRDAKCPRWDQFIDEVTCGDNELAAFLQRSIGYSLTALTTEQCFWILFGGGSNGKTTFVETILAMMGDYGCQIKTEVLLETRYEQKDYHIAELHGKRFVAACESNMGRRLATSLLKQATGSEQLIGRRPYERPFAFYPEFKLWLSTNHRPNVTDSSDAMWRRIHAVPFRARFVKREEAPEGYSGPFIDKDLPERLKSELSGIFNWAVRGCLEWQKSGLEPPRAVKEATKQYREEEDTLGAFLEDCCTMSTDAWEKASALYGKYVSWCKDTGEQIRSQKIFGQLLASRGFKDKRTNSERRWLGLEIKGGDA